MADYSLPQYDLSPNRPGQVAETRAKYDYDMTYQVPTSSYIDPLSSDGCGPAYYTQAMVALTGVRYNLYYALQNHPLPFARRMVAGPDAASCEGPLSPPVPCRLSGKTLTTWLAGAVTTKTLPLDAYYFFAPDLGYGVSSTRARSIDDFKNLYSQQPLPAVAATFAQDSTFARGFLAGPNPLYIRRMPGAQSHFPLTDLHLNQAAGNSGDSLEQAFADGRIFYCDYSSLDGLLPGKYSDGVAKYVYQPIAAFAIPRGGGPLAPFAIQCGQSPSEYQIYTPNDGYSWRLAKNCVLASHNTDHQILAHLGYTHLLLEPIAIAMRRNLAVNHPVHALLNHHCEGTMAVNRIATTQLIQPNRPLDQVVGAEIHSVYSFLAQKRLSYSFTANYLPKRLEAYGTLEAKWLADYPYRDDGMLLWNAIAQWADEFVSVYYPLESDVQTDRELQAFAAEVSSSQAGRVAGFGQTPGSIRSRADLTGILTMILFTAGPQHAVTNFAQLTDMTFTPANPNSGYSPAPTRGTHHTEQDYLDNLPPLEVAVTALEVATILGSINYTRLGNYSGVSAILNGAISDFSGPEIAPAVARFQAQLKAIEAQIIQRNQRRTPYLHLLPSRIPQSINV